MGSVVHETETEAGSSCEWCCEFRTYSVHLHGLNTELPLYDTLLTVLQALSLFVLLFLLNSKYSQLLTIVQRRNNLAYKLNSFHSSTKSARAGSSTASSRSSSMAIFSVAGGRGGGRGGEEEEEVEGEDVESQQRVPLLLKQKERAERDKRKERGDDGGESGKEEAPRRAGVTARLFSFLKKSKQEKNGAEQPQNWVLPVYYKLALAQCIWFTVMAFAYLPSSSKSLLIRYIASVVFSISAFFDNFLVILLCHDRLSLSAKIKSFLLSLFFSILYLIYAIFVPKEKDCPWCGVHFPNSYISIPYSISSFFYILFAVCAKNGWPLFCINIHPAAFIWCSFLIVPYAGAAISIGLLKLYDIDFGYCLLGIVLLWYTVFYAPALYLTMTKDSRYCIQHNKIPDPSRPGDDADADKQQREMVLRLLKDLPPELHDMLSDGTVRLIDGRDIEVYERIGIGGYGEVFRGSWHGTIVAIKTLFAFSAKNRIASLESLLKEVRILSQLRHPNVLLFIGLSLNEGAQSLITEYMSNGSVWDMIHDPQEEIEWSPELVHRLMLQTARGMTYLHHFQPTIIHRDLKSQNLLVDEYFNVKVADFGISRTKDMTTSVAMTAVGTAQWAAPEVLREEKYTEKADVYSFGIIMWELLARQEPYPGTTSLIKLVTQVVNEGLRPDVNQVQMQNEEDRLVYIDLMQRCWLEDAASRPTFDEILDVLNQLNPNKRKSAKFKRMSEERRLHVTFREKEKMRKKQNKQIDSNDKQRLSHDVSPPPTEEARKQDEMHVAVDVLSQRSDQDELLLS
ncbi:putative serine/threonine-protein kinase/receptor [Balamuthia mandrillaris]